MTLSAANAAQASASTVFFYMLVDLVFPAGAIYVTDLPYQVTHDGLIYDPGKILQSIEGMGDHLDGKSRTLSIGLSGLDATLRARTMASRIAFGGLRIRIAFCDRTGQLVDAPEVISQGVLSNAELTYDEGSGDLRINAEDIGILLKRDARQLVTHQSQLQRFPGDTAMRQVADIGSRRLNWGGGSNETQPEVAESFIDRRLSILNSRFTRDFS